MFNSGSELRVESGGVGILLGTSKDRKGIRIMIWIFDFAFAYQGYSTRMTATNLSTVTVCFYWKTTANSYVALHLHRDRMIPSSPSRMGTIIA
jgi:hypothetical protein